MADRARWIVSSLVPQHPDGQVSGLSSLPSRGRVRQTLGCLLEKRPRLREVVRRTPSVVRGRARARACAPTPFRDSCPVRGIFSV